MRKAHEAVKNKLAVAIKTVFVIIGLIIVTNCVKMATDHRTRVFEETPDRVATKARDVEKQLSCLTRNIYWEAASEPFEGKVAVAQVTLNRMESGKFPDSVCGVVFQKTTAYQKVVCQFSWFCETNYQTKAVHRQMYQESEEVAKMVLLEGFRLTSIKEAIYYHADYVNPRWNKEKITQIGHHIFYKDKPNV
jgi:spore germination cell wall hydrolase CwlJ-like protein